MSTETDLKGPSGGKPLTGHTAPWPFNRTLNPHEGFSDEELRSLAEQRDRHRSAARWLFWPTELYSFGRCYREWLGWPTWLPIPVYGDHGVTHSLTMEPHELDNRARYHLTFSRDRSRHNAGLTDREVIHVMNPWIRYRRRKGIQQREDAAGTIVFFAHTLNGIEIPDYDLDEYGGRLEALPSEYQPVVVCLHMHDVRKGHHLRFLDRGIPVVSAGHTSSPYFVDRFYALVTQFRYASSNSGGSDVYYCTELGVPYFLYGVEPTYVNYSHEQRPKGEVRARGYQEEHLQRKKRELFSTFPPRITNAQRRFTTERLGLEAEDNSDELRQLFIREMVRLSPYYARKVAQGYYERAEELGFRETARRVWARFQGGRHA